jgi:hypothetical protein
MRIRMLPSAIEGHELAFLTTFIVNGTVAIDAGALGLWGDLDGHGASAACFSSARGPRVFAPMFVMSLDGENPIVAHGRAGARRPSRDLFNGRWPDFPHRRDAAAARPEEVHAGRPCGAGSHHPDSRRPPGADDGAPDRRDSAGRLGRLAPTRNGAWPRVPISRPCSSGVLPRRGGGTARVAIFRHARCRTRPARLSHARRRRAHQPAIGRRDRATRWPSQLSIGRSSAN